MRQPEPTPAVHPLPWRAVLLSLVVHGMLIAAVALAPPLPRPTEPPTLTMRLLATVPAESDPVPGPMAAEPEPAAPRPPPSETAASTEASAPVLDAPDPGEAPDVDAPSSSGQAPDRTPPTVSSAPRDGRRPGISARILDQIADGEFGFGAEGDAEPGLPWTGTGSAIPGLPGTRGWLSGHVGRVASASQRWQANDGSQRARYVLADGTVVCSQRRAPTIDELMNPWKSLAVTLVSVCGRERPPPPDFSDPRVQSPPRPRSGDAPEG